MTTPDDPLHDHLRQLPDAPLPDGLWTRVNRARVLRMRRRRAGIAAATLAVATVAALSPLMRPATPDPSPTAGPVAAAPAMPVPATLEVELRAIDRALQAGYARNAPDDELEPLWAQRQRLLADNGAPPNAPLPRGLRI